MRLLNLFSKGHQILDGSFPMALFRHIARNSRGASLTDYGLLVGLIAVVAISGVSALGQRVGFVFNVANEEIWMAFNEEGNFLDNGDFDETDGMTERNYGFSSGSLAGWVSLDPAGSPRPFELHQSGHQGMHSVNGGYWLDMAASPGPMHIQQQVDGLIFGRVYAINLFAGDRQPDLTALTYVFWNGELIGEMRASQEDVMEEFRFHIRAGAGDATDTLRLLEVAGPNDSYGMSLDVIRIWGR